MYMNCVRFFKITAITLLLFTIVFHTRAKSVSRKTRDLGLGASRFPTTYTNLTDCGSFDPNSFANDVDDILEKTNCIKVYSDGDCNKKEEDAYIQFFNATDTREKVKLNLQRVKLKNYKISPSSYSACGNEVVEVDENVISSPICQNKFTLDFHGELNEADSSQEFKFNIGIQDNSCVRLPIKKGISNANLLIVPDIDSTAICVELFMKKDCIGEVSRFVITEKSSLWNSEHIRIWDFTTPKSGKLGSKFIRSVRKCSFCVEVEKEMPREESFKMNETSMTNDSELTSAANHFDNLAENKQNSDNLTMIGIAASVLFVIVVVLTVMSILLWRKKRRVRSLRQSCRPRKFSCSGSGPKLERDSHATGIAGLKDFCTTFAGVYEIPCSHIHIDNTNGNKDMSIIGAGEFTVLYKGLLQPEGRTVAVKTMKNGGPRNVKALRNTLEECQIFLHLGKHPGIVELLGVSTKNVTNGELYIVMEWCERGSLKRFLVQQKNNFVNLVRDGEWIIVEETEVGMDKNHVAENDRIKFNTIDLFKWCSEVAEAMEYLASRKIVHVSLSARNVLLNEHFSCKISDFRLAKMPDDWPETNHGTFVEKPKKGRAPWRSYAVESLMDDVFSTQTDVWTFGIFMWEVFSLGADPFSEYTFGPEFILCLKHGYRLQIPNNASVESYQLMLMCWYDDPEMRPMFTKLKLKLGAMVPRKLRNNTVNRELSSFSLNN